MALIPTRLRSIFLIIFHAGAIEFLSRSPEKSTAFERWNADVHSVTSGLEIAQIEMKKNEK